MTSSTSLSSSSGRGTLVNSPATSWRCQQSERSIIRHSFLTPPACFDESCQAAKDALYLGSLLVPVGVFSAVALYLFNRPNEATTTVDSTPKWGEGKAYEISYDDANDIARDNAGELCYRAVRWVFELRPPCARKLRLSHSRRTLGLSHSRRTFFRQVHGGSCVAL